MATMAMLEQQHHRRRGLQPPGRGSRLLVAAVDERLPPPSHGGNGGWGLLDADAGRKRVKRTRSLRWRTRDLSVSIEIKRSCGPT